MARTKDFDELEVLNKAVSFFGIGVIMVLQCLTW
jgi:hypothetical protein